MTSLLLALARRPARAPADPPGDPLPPGAVMRLSSLRHRTAGVGVGRFYLADGRTLLTHTATEVRRFDADSGRELAWWAAPAGLEVLGVSPDGRLALLADPLAVRVWDLAARRELRTFPDANRFRGVAAARFSPDGRHVVLVDQDEQHHRRVQCWDV